MLHSNLKRGSPYSRSRGSNLKVIAGDALNSAMYFFEKKRFCQVYPIPRSYLAKFHLKLLYLRSRCQYAKSLSSHHLSTYPHFVLIPCSSDRHHQHPWSVQRIQIAFAHVPLTGSLPLKIHHKSWRGSRCPHDVSRLDVSGSWAQKKGADERSQALVNLCMDGYTGHLISFRNRMCWRSWL